MNLTIELPDELGAALQAYARAQGVSPDHYLTQVLEHTLMRETGQQNAGEPFETGRGMLAQYGPAPSKEEIDANRAEMFHGFAEDF